MPACWIRCSALFKIDFTQISGPVRAAFFSIMSTPDTQRPDTPCVAVCSTTFDDVCRGCGRTVAEVADWVFMTQAQKDKIWDRLLSEGYPRRNT